MDYQVAGPRGNGSSLEAISPADDVKLSLTAHLKKVQVGGFKVTVSVWIKGKFASLSFEGGGKRVQVVPSCPCFLCGLRESSVI